MALSVLFRSQTQASILAELFLVPGERSLTELGAAAGVSTSVAKRVVDTLEGAGLVTSRTVGVSRLVSAVDGGGEADLVRELVLRTHGPVKVVGEAFGAIPGVQELSIYGSWAARYSGESGPPPNDIDVLVVGTPEVARVYDAADAASARLGVAVNPHIVSPSEWSSPTSPFLRHVLQRPRVSVPLPDDRGDH